MWGPWPPLRPPWCPSGKEMWYLRYQFSTLPEFVQPTSKEIFKWHSTFAKRRLPSQEKSGLNDPLITHTVNLAKKVLQFCLEQTFRLKCLYAAEYYYLFEEEISILKKVKNIKLQIHKCTIIIFGIRWFWLFWFACRLKIWLLDGKQKINLTVLLMCLQPTIKEAIGKGKGHAFEIGEPLFQRLVNIHQTFNVSSSEAETWLSRKGREPELQRWKMTSWKCQRIPRQRVY